MTKSIFISTHQLVRRARLTIPAFAASLLLLGSLASADTFSADELLSSTAAMRERGEFAKATEILSGVLSKSSAVMTTETRSRIEFEIERIRRTRLDYTVTREELLKGIQKKVPDFTSAELDRMELDGKVDTLTIDGTKWYVGSSPSNVPRADLAVWKRRKPAEKLDGTYRKLYTHMLQVKEARKTARENFVLPQKFIVDFRITVKANQTSVGDTLRAWLPFARNFPFQGDAEVLATSPADHVIAPPEWAHRTIYMEQPSNGDRPTTFTARYIYECYARAFDLDPAAAQPYDPNSPAMVYARSKPPHLDNDNPTLRAISARVVGDEKNPVRVAKKLFDWVANDTAYQFAREYSTIDNLAEYTANRRGGDCGQRTMLYLALLRINDIPARWQSGWESFEATRNNNMHDWCELYIEPWGWVPADVDMAGSVKYADDELTPAQAQELADWFFGNIDHFRLNTNADWGEPLFPAKQDFRSETVDFQRGEVESNGKNLYFNQWNYSMKFTPVTSKVAEKLLAPRRPPVPKFPSEKQSVKPQMNADKRR